MISKFMKLQNLKNKKGPNKSDTFVDYFGGYSGDTYISIFICLPIGSPILVITFATNTSNIIFHSFK